MPNSFPYCTSLICVFTMITVRSSSGGHKTAAVLTVSFNSWCKAGAGSHASSDGGPESYVLNPANERPKNTSSCNGHNCAGNYLIGKTHTQTEPSRLALAAKVRAAAACQLSKFVSWLQLKSSSCCFIVPLRSRR